MLPFFILRHCPPLLAHRLRRVPFSNSHDECEVSLNQMSLRVLGGQPSLMGPVPARDCALVWGRFSWASGLLSWEEGCCLCGGTPPPHTPPLMGCVAGIPFGRMAQQGAPGCVCAKAQWYVWWLLLSSWTQDMSALGIVSCCLSLLL